MHRPRSEIVSLSKASRAKCSRSNPLSPSSAIKVTPVRFILRRNCSPQRRPLTEHPCTSSRSRHCCQLIASMVVTPTFSMSKSTRSAGRRIGEAQFVYPRDRILSTTSSTILPTRTVKVVSRRRQPPLKFSPYLTTRHNTNTSSSRVSIRISYRPLLHHCLSRTGSNKLNNSCYHPDSCPY